MSSPILRVPDRMTSISSPSPSPSSPSSSLPVKQQEFPAPTPGASSSTQDDDRSNDNANSNSNSNKRIVGTLAYLSRLSSSSSSSSSSSAHNNSNSNSNTIITRKCHFHHGDNNNNNNNNKNNNNNQEDNIDHHHQTANNDTIHHHHHHEQQNHHQQQTIRNDSLSPSQSQSQSQSISLPLLFQRFAFVIAYDGTPFHGLAKDPQQPNTIQAHVEHKLASMLGRSRRRSGRTTSHQQHQPSSFSSSSCSVVFNGRTDAGVHSNGTVFHVDFTKEEVLRFGSSSSSSSSSSKTKHKNKQKRNNNNNKSNNKSNKSKDDEKETQQQQQQQYENDKNENDTDDIDINIIDPALATARLFQKTLRRGLIGSEGLQQQHVIQQHIQVRAVYPVTPKFHARKSCVGKRYSYTIHEGYPMPLEARSCWAMNGRRLDIIKMNIVAQECLVGKRRDCSILFVRDKRGRSDNRSPIREIQCIDILRQQQPQQQQQENDNDNDDDDSVVSNNNNNNNSFGRIVISIQADFFLTNMCRRMVGLLVQVGLGKVTPQEVKELLEPVDDGDGGNDHVIRRTSRCDDTTSNSLKHNKKMDRFLHTAPAKGLCLEYVIYDSQGNGRDPTLPADHPSVQT